MSKLIPESLNELYNFERNKGDIYKNLNIGKRQLIINWLENELELKYYTIKNNLTIDVNENIDLRHKNLIELPEFIQFNEVFGGFWSEYNNLISLRGCPKIVHGNFECQHNKLESLEGCPEKVYSFFYCYVVQYLSIK